MTRSATVQALVRRTHEERVLSVLRERGALSRAQIADLVGLSRTTLSEITADLIGRGSVVVTRTDGDVRRGSGRPAELLALDPGAGQFVGVDLGHRRVRVVIADAAHDVVASGIEAYAATLPWPGRQQKAFDLLARVAADHGLHFGALQGIAVGVAGPDATARDAVRAAFDERFGCPVLVDNNTRFAALAEAMSDAGSVEEAGDLAYVRVSDGIGGGFVVGGRLVTGGLGAAGEFGHVRADLGDGAVSCRCGKRGCLETVASVPAVLDAAGVDDPAALAAALRDGRPAARHAVDRAAEALGRVVADAALLLSPARIVLGGELPRLAPYVVDRVAAAVAAELGALGTGRPLVRRARLDDEDGARGAIAALYHQSPLLVDYQLATTAAGTESWRNRA